MIELPSAQNILEEICREDQWVLERCATCSVQVLELHMRRIHILSTKYKSLYAKSRNEQAKICW